MPQKSQNSIEKIYVATDCDKIKKISSRYNVEFIDRPKLNTNKALGDHVFEYSYNQIKKNLKKKIELVVLLFANAPTINFKLIDKGIALLKKINILIQLLQPQCIICGAKSPKTYERWHFKTFCKV